jgi:hypothetical protein
VTTFQSVFDASVALQNGDEVTALIDGHRVIAFELHDRFVLVLDGRMVQEGDAFDVALAYVRTTRALDTDPKFTSRKSSHTRLTALADVPIKTGKST